MKSTNSVHTATRSRAPRDARYPDRPTSNQDINISPPPADFYKALLHPRSPRRCFQINGPAELQRRGPPRTFSIRCLAFPIAEPHRAPCHGPPTVHFAKGTETGMGLSSSPRGGSAAGWQTALISGVGNSLDDWERRGVRSVGTPTPATNRVATLAAVGAPTLLTVGAPAVVTVGTPPRRRAARQLPTTALSIAPV